MPGEGRAAGGSASTTLQPCPGSKPGRLDHKSRWIDQSQAWPSILLGMATSRFLLAHSTDSGRPSRYPSFFLSVSLKLTGRGAPLNSISVSHP